MSIAIDGGRDYLKVTKEPDAIYEIVRINLLTDEVEIVNTKSTNFLKKLLNKMKIGNG
jgi:hypothetical protein